MGLDVYEGHLALNIKIFTKTYTLANAHLIAIDSDSPYIYIYKLIQDNNSRLNENIISYL